MKSLLNSFLLTLFLVQFFVTPALAQSLVNNEATNSIDKTKKDSDTQGSKINKRTLLEVESDNFFTPFNHSSSALILGAGSILSYLSYRDTKNSGRYGYTEDHQEVTWCDWMCQGNIIGWGLLQVGYTLTQLPGIYNNDKKALNNTEMMWKSSLYTSLYTLGLKLAVRSQRRNGEKKFDSFPSGHASSAFAFATNIALRHEWYWNFISVPLAYFISSSRVASDDHYTHDTIFGAALGISIAYGMNKKELPFMFGFSPVEDGAEISLQYNF